MNGNKISCTIPSKVKVLPKIEAFPRFFQISHFELLSSSRNWTELKSDTCATYHDAT